MDFIALFGRILPVYTSIQLCTTRNLCLPNTYLFWKQGASLRVQTFFQFRHISDAVPGPELVIACEQVQLIVLLWAFDRTQGCCCIIV